MEVSSCPRLLHKMRCQRTFLDFSKEEKKDWKRCKERLREEINREKKHEEDRFAALILPSRKALLSCMSVFVEIPVAVGSSHSNFVFSYFNHSKT